MLVFKTFGRTVKYLGLKVSIFSTNHGFSFDRYSVKTKRSSSAGRIAHICELKTLPSYARKQDEIIWKNCYKLQKMLL